MDPEGAPRRRALLDAALRNLGFDAADLRAPRYAGSAALGGGMLTVAAAGLGGGSAYRCCLSGGVANLGWQQC